MAQFRTDNNQYLKDGKTIFEVGMLSSRLTASGTATDAFGRLRVSEPLTLFDSFHRYQDNNKFATSTAGTANTVHKPNESIVEMNVNTASGDKCYRETKKVFAYQPGKSLLIMNTFVMNAQKTNLRQRVGYFSSQNGVYFENDGTSNYLVLRSFVTGSIVETRIAQENWNIDKFDGSGFSSQTGHTSRGGLDITKANIFWIDIEWLGVGDVRCGFVVDGLMVPAHIFHNDNINTTTYMTTAVLPVRYEIENTGTTASSSKMKQICSTVISEGGYALTGRPRNYSQSITPGVRLTTPGTFYPALSIRLNPDYPDALVIPSAASILPINAGNYQYKFVLDATIAGATWVNAASDSFVQYNSNASATMSGGSSLTSGFVTSTVQGGGSLLVLGSDIFRYQLERDRFANTTTTLTIAVTSDTATVNCSSSISWEEVT